MLTNTEPSNLEESINQAPQHPDYINMLNKRVLFKDEFATVKYAGNLHHDTGTSKVKKDDIWLGIEWENGSLGKHNGVVSGVRYFSTKDNQPTGSLVIASKAEFGVDLLEGLIIRYFKDHEVQEILKHKDNIIEYLKLKYEKEVTELEQRKLKKAEELDLQKAEDLKKQILEGKDHTDVVDDVKKEVEDTKFVMKEEQEEEEKVKKTKGGNGENSDDESGSENEDNMFIDEDGDNVDEIKEGGGTGGVQKMSEKRNKLLDKLQSKIQSKDSYRDQTISVDFHEDAYIKTFGDRIKRIEFHGFDKVWERLHNLNRVQSLGLNNHKVSNLGPLGQFNQICGNLDSLSLEHNLLCSWDQIFILGYEAPKITQLALSYNNLILENETEIQFNCLKTYNHLNQTFSMPENIRSNLFVNLEHLILIQTNQTFKKLNVVLKSMPEVKHLILSKNFCNDFENIDTEIFKNVITLNLEDNKINCNILKGDLADQNIPTQHKLEILGQLPNLKRLILIKNNIQTMRQISVFEKIETLNISENNISCDSIFRELSTLPKLASFMFRRDPIIYQLGEGHVKQLIISYLSHLISYNSDLKFYRQDAELYIMRHSFHEYFKLFNLDQFTYKYEDYVSWAQINYPVSFRLIAKYENPYPPLDKEKLQQEELDNLQRKTQQTNYVYVKFQIDNGPLIGHVQSKQYPITTDFLYIRNFISQYFKMKKKENILFKYKNHPNDPFTEVDDLTKGLDYYGVKTGSIISITQLDQE